ncbi:UDP-N-acetylglucosamine--N-acetylmuramyl-(pentapeptide) pyrophosphoryl-undecaprenol N-acetylglucosamine transferase [Paraliomyxa miuraensis]|uniref:UDP-N-acetylglucosamine--N-acetylmuramyl- (pentapeptide) pyrophosphoryl-undecaprenol N-acetylglucosamine transferase n=1 Tax=Paraliomyxa miuraensis TaxID=376150 RepID=UPI002256B81F|nr:UDP-N-acetylglucosamine--N-acetylmuramyl-(pentapeptide) pyrophosphoryl-undecaprenol N-acetylglucosamine transferase [Paraliomyxa miuraensis]MCX4245239.1 UDP-N-acetylglucosamine--N-acetylmuramyl-(pentapeptide) pyrophosphoryl-undecaprenol N-acetylglucosamine transferase [Paraliomyxa miuraensis]
MSDRDPNDGPGRGPGTVLLAGGGTGGHIYPNVGIMEALRARRPDAKVRFLVSDRPGDPKIMERLGEAYSQSPVRPLPSLRKPWQALPFLLAWRQGTAQLRRLLSEHRIAAVVATGGFVSGPAIAVAASAGLPRAMVNLDAVPGQANRLLVRRCSRVFTAYRSELLPGADAIGLPMRAASVGDRDPAKARAALGLPPERPLLFVTGATHGATSIIHTMEALLRRPAIVEALAGWQVLHQCGTHDVPGLQRAYDDAKIHAKVVDYLEAMGQAWSAADLAVSRAGAGSVAEAWANAAPTVFLPNPYHRDQHQRHNAQPMVDGGGAIMLRDEIDPERNAELLTPVLLELLGDRERRDGMREAARQTCPPDGAAAVAAWLDDVLG